MGWITHCSQHTIDSCGQITQCVEQCAVQIEDNRFVPHDHLDIFKVLDFTLYISRGASACDAHKLLNFIRFNNKSLKRQISSPRSFDNLTLKESI
jgi:hypothetical protein